MSELAFSFSHLHAPTPTVSCEDTAVRQLSANQEESSHQEVSGWAPWYWTSQPPELGETHFRCVSHPAHGIFVTAAWTKTLLFKMLKKKKRKTRVSFALPSLPLPHDPVSLFLSSSATAHWSLRTVWPVTLCQLACACVYLGRGTSRRQQARDLTLLLLPPCLDQSMALHRLHVSATVSSPPAKAPGLCRPCWHSFSLCSLWFPLLLVPGWLNYPYGAFNLC